MSVTSNSFILSQNLRRQMNSDRNGMGGNNNILVVGGAGTGKTRNIVKPNLLQMNCSYVITDPSGDLLYSLGNGFVNHGYKITVLNLVDMMHSDCYNPLSYIKDDSDVFSLVDCLMENTSVPNAKAGNYWSKAERLLYSACIFYLRDFCNDDSEKNFHTIWKMIKMSLVDENDTESQLDKLFNNLPKDSLAAQYYQTFKQTAGKTIKDICVSCSVRIQAFTILQFEHLTKKDDMRLDKIGYEKTALFIINSQVDTTYSFLISMLYSQLLKTLYSQGEKQRLETGASSSPIHVRFMMDEFANCGKIPEFPLLLSTMKLYNISATIIVQDISQIEAVYKDQWEMIVSNCSSLIFLGSTNTNTWKYFSRKLGIKTTSLQKQKIIKDKDIIQQKITNELKDIASDDCIVFMQNCSPFFDKKYKYEEHINYGVTADADSSLAFKFRRN